VLLPKTGSFRMSLEGMEDGQDLFAIKGNVKSSLVPISEGVVYAQESWNFGSRRVCECILCIATID
jgi:hypothetical protein